MKQLILAVMLTVATAYAKKKPQPVETPTQEPVIQGCITVLDITFRPFKMMHPPLMTGNIINACGKDAYVSIVVDYFDAYDNKMSTSFVEKLSRAGSILPFFAEPSGYSNLRVFKTGRVTTVYGHF